MTAERTTPRADRSGPPTPVSGLLAPDAPGARPAGLPLPRLLAGAALVGLGTLLLALLLGGGRPEPAVPGLPSAGPVTGWAFPVARLVFDLAALTAVGILLTGTALVPSASPRLTGLSERAVRAGGWCAAAWSVGALVLLLLRVSETAGVPLAGLTPAVLAEEIGAWGNRSLLLVAALSGGAAVGSALARTRAAAWGVLLLAVAALVPVTVTGHAASAADHDLATTSLLVHVVASSLWIGGLLGVLLLLARAPRELAVAVPRYSAVALACFALVAMSGVLSAWTRLGLTAAAWTSGYGALVLAKAAGLLALGLMGWHHRRRLVPGLSAGRRSAFLAFAGLEVVVMAAVSGLAVALTRTPPPAAAAQEQPAHGGGHETLSTSVEPVTLLRLLTEWRLDALALAVLGLAAAAYVVGVRTVRRRGQAWPAARTASFAAGLLVALVAWCAGLATYAPAMVSVQLAQFLLVLLVAPALLVLGAPLTLLLQARGTDAPPVLRSRAVQLLTDPLTGLVVVTALLFAVYRTPLIEVSLRDFGVHRLVNGVALAAGLLLLWPALGADPLPKRRAPFERAVPLLGTAASLLVIAAQLRYGDQVLAGQWFFELRWTWVEPLSDQRRGAVVVAAATALLLLLTGAAWRAPQRVLAPPAGARSAAS